jgi:redox-sensitive bicupin YhaK (pirin superfamily)
MSVKFIQTKHQLKLNSYNNGIHEVKTVGYPYEKTPLKPYSNILYWSRLRSEYGNLMSEHPHIGFEMLSYVTKGTFEVFDHIENKWVRLSEGDICVVKAGKGMRHSEKLAPQTEVLQVWFDPGFKDIQQKSLSTGNRYFSSNMLVHELQNRKTRIIDWDRTPGVLQSKDSSVEMTDFFAGYHTLTCMPDYVMSGCVLDGYIEINDTLLGKDDFFRIEQQTETSLISLVNSKVFITITPFEPEYQTYASVNRWA